MAFPRKIRLGIAKQVEIEELDRVEAVGTRVLLLLDGESPFVKTRLSQKGIDADQARACGERRLSGIPASLPLSGSRSIIPSEEREFLVVVCDHVRVGLKLSTRPIPVMNEQRLRCRLGVELCDPLGARIGVRDDVVHPHCKVLAIVLDRLDHPQHQ